MSFTISQLQFQTKIFQIIAQIFFNSFKGSFVTDCAPPVDLRELLNPTVGGNQLLLVPCFLGHVTTVQVL